MPGFLLVRLTADRCFGIPARDIPAPHTPESLAAALSTHLQPAAASPAAPRTPDRSAP